MVARSKFTRSKVGARSDFRLVHKILTPLTWSGGEKRGRANTSKEKKWGAARWKNGVLHQHRFWSLSHSLARRFLGFLHFSKRKAQIGHQLSTDIRFVKKKCQKRRTSDWIGKSSDFLKIKFPLKRSRDFKCSSNLRLLIRLG